MIENQFLDQMKKYLEASQPDKGEKFSEEDIKVLLSITDKYRILYDIGKLIASEMEFNGLLRLAMDKVIEVTQAHRGFIALLDDNHELDFKVARNMEKSDISKPKFQISRSIIKEVIAKGESLYVPDAVADATFGNKESVTRLQLLSVLCTPIRLENCVVGLIYVDNSSVKNLFNEQIVNLLSAFSEQIAISLKNAFVYNDLKTSHQKLANELRATHQFDSIIGFGHRMTEILQLVADVADTDATVLIQGENGTGKELIAKALHYNNQSSREKAFITINCGAIPKDLIESELFGHVKGAFTGAIKDRRGKFELAEGGTIFLDEIGEMDTTLQVKLLRIFEDGVFTPVGSEREKQSDVRIIAATNRDLKKLISEKLFREDLYYRLNVIGLTMPPLRDRREDIPLLINHFIQKFNTNKKIPDLTKRAEQILLDYDYPGNVRQLQNIIHRAVILCKGSPIDVQYLPEDVLSSINYKDDINKPTTFQERKQKAIEHFEQKELMRILILTGGKIRESARVAGMDVKNFSEKLKKYGIKSKEFKK